MAKSQDSPKEKDTLDIEGSFQGVKEEAGKIAHPLSLIANSISQMVIGAELLDKNFSTARTRILEMNEAVARTTPIVDRLGGDIKSTLSTIEDIALASKRNVIESEETIGKVYATSQVTGIQTRELVESFTNIGQRTADIGKNVETSISYIRGIGLNAKTVMSDVVSNMEQMNRYQFEGGVQGLTKMAAQASMLKFDMRETFRFAEKVVDPEGAINMASAFQRLGVAAGNLADPFQLMNQSINDPSGLQDSIINMTKQFTYFDEQTKTFKINPQGVLTLRELSRETGISYDELTKTAIAASDLDQRLSKISLDIPEDDKKMLANMARMGAGGEYEVKVKRGGEDQFVKLSEVTRDEFAELKKIQEEAPKDMEDIARSQLDTLKLIQSDLKAVTDKLGLSVAGLKDVRTNMEGIRNVVGAVTGTVSKKVVDADVTKELEKPLANIKKLFEDISVKGLTGKDLQERMSKFEQEAEKGFLELGPKAVKVFKEIMKEAGDKIKPNSQVEKYFKENVIDKIVGGKVTSVTPPNNISTNFRTNNNRVSGSIIGPTNYSKSVMSKQESSKDDGEFGTLLEDSVEAGAQRGTERGMKDALKHFENPGTLKVSIYADKAGLAKNTADHLKGAIKENKSEDVASIDNTIKKTTEELKENRNKTITTQTTEQKTEPKKETITSTPKKVPSVFEEKYITSKPYVTSIKPLIDTKTEQRVTTPVNQVRQKKGISAVMPKTVSLTPEREKEDTKVSINKDVVNMPGEKLTETYINEIHKNFQSIKEKYEKIMGVDDKDQKTKKTLKITEPSKKINKLVDTEKPIGSKKQDRSKIFPIDIEKQEKEKIELPISKVTESSITEIHNILQPIKEKYEKVFGVDSGDKRTKQTHGNFESIKKPEVTSGLQMSLTSELVKTLKEPLSVMNQVGYKGAKPITLPSIKKPDIIENTVTSKIENAIKEEKDKKEKLTSTRDKFRSVYTSDKKEESRDNLSLTQDKISTTKSTLTEKLMKENQKSEKLIEKLVKDSELLTKDYSKEEDNTKISKEKNRGFNFFRKKDSNVDAEPIKNVNEGTTLSKKFTAGPIGQNESTISTIEQITKDNTEKKEVNGSVNMGGDINIKVDAPPGVSLQWLTEHLNSPEFKEKVYKYVDDKAIEMERKKN